MNIDNDTTELSFVQQRLHGVSATSQCYSPFNNREHTCDSANVTSQSAVLSLASTATTNYPMIQHLLPQILILGLHVQPQELDPMPVEVTTVAKQEPDTGDRRYTKPAEHRQSSKKQTQDDMPVALKMASYTQKNIYKVMTLDDVDNEKLRASFEGLIDEVSIPPEPDAPPPESAGAAEEDKVKRMMFIIEGY
ncbi:hypothetical protein Tco_0227322 [Tanacetum coccineum]